MKMSIVTDAIAQYFHKRRGNRLDGWIALVDMDDHVLDIKKYTFTLVVEGTEVTLRAGGVHLTTPKTGQVRVVLYSYDKATQVAVFDSRHLGHGETIAWG